MGNLGDPVKVPLPHISGSDVAGTVVEAGEEVTKLKVGDRVVSHSNMSCRVCDKWRREENMTVMNVSYGVFKLVRFGVVSVNILIYLK